MRLINTFYFIRASALILVIKTCDSSGGEGGRCKAKIHDLEFVEYWQIFL